MSVMTATLHDFFEITKPRICLMALLMATIGYVMGSDGTVSASGLFWMLLGTGLVGASSGALNQFLEVETDSRMWRTLKRPLPAGRLEKNQVLVFGWVSGFLGVMLLLVAVNSVAAVLGALALLFYLSIYTPSKLLTPLSALIGAIPGALPPLIGWTAAYGKMAPMGYLLFAILFLWQIPHFLAIGWTYREDYARAGIPILSVVDPEGLFAGKQMVTYSAVLIPVSLLPTVWKVTGATYFYGALMVGLAMLTLSVCLALYRNRTFARRLFWTSLLYLPVIGVLMVWDRV